MKEKKRSAELVTKTGKTVAAKASTVKSRTASGTGALTQASAARSKPPVSDPVGRYMRERRGALGKGYKLSY